MSFSSEVKEELKTKTDTAKHCQIAEFAAMMAFGGHIHTDTNKKYTIVFVTENETVAAVFTELAAKIFGITENEIIKDGLQLIIRDEKYVKHILMTLKWLTDDNLNDAKRVFADPLIVQKDCCKRAFIKGAFLTAHIKTIRYMTALLYVNRKVNCETANLNKTIEAAVKQIRDIEYIRDTVGLDYLKPTLRDVARLRLDNPDMNLKDIGELLDPPVGKSGVNHRLRKISETAQSLRGE